MSRNATSHFGSVPQVDIRRSSFSRDFGLKTTFNAGQLVPIYCEEILPGDTFLTNVGAAIRMSTPVVPVMDNAWVDIFFFFVPARLCWEHWREFMGENRESAWAQPVEYEVPQLKAPSGGWQEGTIADYLGIPVGVENISVNALPFRAYSLIYNEWFRDQNIKDPCHVNLDDATQTGSNGDNYITDCELGGKPAHVAKVHDYFTSALPEPQKGEPVLLPLSGMAWVRSGEPREGIEQADWAMKLYQQDTLKPPSGKYTIGVGTDGSVFRENSTTATASPGLFPANLYADLTTATAATINQLRQSFAVQRLLERDARGGSRYTEIIRSHFGVVSPDARLQRPEYLGGARIPVSMDQVLQTSGTTDVSPQGNTAAYSLTNFRGNGYIKSFTEHGYVLGLAAVRHDLTYQQGIPRYMSRHKRFDFYWSALANIGEQAILNKEIYAQGNAQDDEAFGYQEAWAEYRVHPNMVTGGFRSKPDGSGLDVWHYADYYDKLPTLSPEWIDANDTAIARSLALPKEQQFIADFFFRQKVTRPMPLYSVPGLIDHY